VLHFQKASAIVIALMILSTGMLFLTDNIAGKISTFAQPNETNQTNLNSASIPEMNQVSTKKIRVGDIDVGYRKLGKGDPLFMIMGFKGTMETWDQRLLQNLASKYTLVLFDNR
jgi:hypothetical protein